MEVRFADATLARLATDPKFSGKWSAAVVKIFRRRIQAILDAHDEQDLRGYPAFHFEKLKGKRAHEHSMRLNDQWRLIIELQGNSPRKAVVIVKGIEDYH